MTFTYPAIFRKLDDGSFDGYFPDLEGCKFKGATLDDAIDDAIAEERDWITTELEDVLGGLPYVTDKEDIHLAPNEHIRTITVIVRLMDGFDE